MPTNAQGETRAAILREVMETAYFDLRNGKPRAEVIKRIGDTLNDDAAITGRFEGTEGGGVTALSKARLFGTCEDGQVTIEF